MADDTEESSTLAVLSKRVDFHGWQQSMLLYAMEKGDMLMEFLQTTAQTRRAVINSFLLHRTLVARAGSY